MVEESEAEVKTNGSKGKSNTETIKSTTKARKTKKPENAIPRGQPKSNRPWKTPKTKFTSIQKSKPRLSFDKKMALRNELRAIKERSREIKEARKEAAAAKQQRRIENAERRLANERKAEIVQVIKNPAKLKRMKKKQMRLIEKRDLSQVKVV